MSNNAKYKLTGKHINGIKISKFTVEALDEDKKLVISYEDTIKLARAGKIKDIEVLIDTVNQQYIIDFKNKLYEIPVHSSIELDIVYRLVDGSNKCIGYKVQDSKGKSYKLSINKTWELANDNCINNVKAKIINNKKVMIGTGGFKITELPIMNE